jgi:hypothetical protein
MTGRIDIKKALILTTPRLDRGCFYAIISVNITLYKPGTCEKPFDMENCDVTNNLFSKLTTIS